MATDPSDRPTFAALQRERGGDRYRAVDATATDLSVSAKKEILRALTLHSSTCRHEYKVIPTRHTCHPVHNLALCVGTMHHEPPSSFFFFKLCKDDLITLTIESVQFTLDTILTNRLTNLVT